MSLPPEIIQIKRLKRKASDDEDDDSPLDYLRVDSRVKRNRSEPFIYQRSIPQANGKTTDNVVPPREIVPVIHSSKGLEADAATGKGSSQRKSESIPAAQTVSKPKNETTEELAQHTETRKALKPSSNSEPRRFHFSRPLITPTSLLKSGSSTGKRSRHNTPTTMFVERGHKRTRTEDIQMKDAESSEVKDAVASEELPRKLKLPGSDRKGPVAMKPAAPAKKEIPESMKKDWAGDVDEITRNMNDFALQLIGENLARIEERDRKEAEAAAKATASPRLSKFRPKVPAKRYAERHPEIAAAQKSAVDAGNASDKDYETASEDEYIIETYVRVPAESLVDDLDPVKIGLLVFDNEPDAEFFYGEEGDSDDEWPEDDEDENAENYYTADYPDDEVDFDDEYDRDAYHYRTGNASDMEEYDERNDNYLVEHDADDDEKPIPLSTRFGPMPPAAFKGL